MIKNNIVTKVFSLFFIIIMLLTLNSCRGNKKVRDVIDQKLDKSYKEYEEDLFSPEETKKRQNPESDEPPLPEILPILATPPQPLVGKDKLISLSVTEDVPLKDVLIELSRLADIDIELDPSISGGIILKVKNKPLSEVIDRIAKLADLRYSSVNGVLKIEKDTPYVVNYQVDFINLTRSNKSNVSVKTSLASGSGGSSGGIGSGSTSDITSTYDGDLWDAVQKDIIAIIAPRNTLFGGGEKDKVGASNANASNFLSINKQAGIISILGNSRQQSEVKNYLDRIKNSVSAQVLIEAKVLEVTLADEYKAGINWMAIDSKLKSGVGMLGKFLPADFNDISGASIPGRLSLGVFKNHPSSYLKGDGLAQDDLQALVQLTQQFGNTRTLSSPRLHAMNNQQAILSFAQNKVYFTLKIDNTSTASTTTSGSATTTTTVNSTANTVPIGIILSLQPSINLETDEITMNIRPTISRLIGKGMADPAVTYLIAQNSDLQGKGLESYVPEVEVKELDSVMKIKSGEVMVIGGLMTENAANTDNGVPFISSVPVVGNLFKSVNKGNKVTQTVIFIRATIMPSSTIPVEDKHFYNNFIRKRDTHPINFERK